MLNPSRSIPAAPGVFVCYPKSVLRDGTNPNSKVIHAMHVDLTGFVCTGAVRRRMEEHDPQGSYRGLMPPNRGP